MRAQIGILTMLVLLTATALVPTAQASVVEWEFTNADAPSTAVTAHVIDASGSGLGTPASNVSLTNGAVWASNAAATEAITVSGSWSLNLQFTDVTPPLSGIATVNLFIGTWNPTTGFSSQDIQQALTFTESEWVGTRMMTVNVDAGEHLAFWLEEGAGTTASLRIGTSDGTSPSTISSPDQDPNFPVPELASVLLVAAGLVIIAGVVYTKKRQA